MRYTFIVDVEVSRVSGKFASRDEVGEAISEALGDAESDVSLDGLGADGESEYQIDSWSVAESTS